MRNLFSVLLLFCASASLLLCQSGPEKIDAGPYSPTEGSSYEQVSVMNGSLQTNIPVWSFKQRGRLKLDFTLRYDSPTFVLSTTCINTSGVGASVPAAQQGSSSASSSNSTGVQPDATQNPGYCNPPAPCKTTSAQQCFGGYFIPSPPQTSILPSTAQGGVSLLASTALAIYSNAADNANGNPINLFWNLVTPDQATHKIVATNGGQWRAADGTGWLYQPSNCTLTDGEGTRYVFQCTAVPSPGILSLIGGTSPGPLQYEEDTNGNRITVNYGQYNSIISWTDTMGRTIPAPAATSTVDTRCSAGSTGSTTWQIPGVSIPVLFCGTGVPIQSALLPTIWKTDGYTEATGTMSTMSRMVLPDGDTWTFTYVPQPGDPNYGTSINYGELTRIDLPTGGSIRYYWNTVGQSCANHASPPVTVRREINERQLSVDGNTWSSWLYSIGSSAAATSYQSKVTDPYNNYAVHALTIVGACSFYETRVDNYAQGGTLLRTDETDFEALPQQEADLTNGIGALPIAHRTIWPDGSTKGTTLSYDPGFAITNANGNAVSIPYGLVTQEQDFDYGQNGSIGGLLRTSVTNYWWQANATALGYNILNPISTSTITDNVNGGTREKTYGYDGFSLANGNATVGWDSAPPNGNVRGNQTQVYVHNTTSGAILETDLTYTNTGMVSSITPPTDPNISPASATNFQYSSNYQGALLTLETDSLGHQTQYTYYPTTNLLNTVTDANSATTTYSYQSDTRLQSIVYPTTAAGAPETDYSYPSAAQVNKSVKEYGSSSIVTEAIYDGLGRPSSAVLLGGCPGGDYIQTDTTYDLAGRVFQKSNPHCHASTSTSDGTITYTTYDGLGRPSLLTMQDGTSTQKWSYNDETITFTDENNNAWARTTDALGRLAKVIEPGTRPTTYGYNAFGDLTSVIQTGVSSVGEVPRVRSFTYNGLSQLVTASNPETGIICYGTVYSGQAPNPTNCTPGYDNHGNLLHKTDARGVTISYAYDALNRLLSKTYSSAAATPSSCFQYDISSLVSSGGNLAGRLTNSWTQTGACPAASSPPSFLSNTNILSRHSILGYDAMGRVTSEQQCTKSNCSTATPYNPAYTYDLAGDMINYSNGVRANPMTFTNGYDGAGHLCSVLNGTYSLFATPQYAAGSGCTSANATLPGYSPAGALMNATFGTGLKLTRAYDNRLRISSETDTGNAAISPIPGAATITIVGTDQTH